MTRRTITGSLLAAQIAVQACHDASTFSGLPANPDAAIAVGNITVQALPAMTGASGRAVGGDGTVFLMASSSSPYGLAAWDTPGAPGTTTIDAYGWPWYSAANVHGDVAGPKRQNGIESGVWVKTGPASWAFTLTPKNGARDYSVNGINDTREMAGFVLTTSFQPAFFPAPGASAVTLPFPAGHTSGFAEGINGAGDIVGRSKGSVDSPVIWQRTGQASWTPTLLPKPYPSSSGSGYVVNASRQVVGKNNGRVYRWTPAGSSWTTTLVSTGDYRPGMDACGRVVGTVPLSTKPSLYKPPRRGYIWDGTLTYLPLPSGADRSEAHAISMDPVAGVQIITGWAGKGTSQMYPVKWTIPGCP